MKSKLPKDVFTEYSVSIKPHITNMKSVVNIWLCSFPMFIQIFYIFHPEKYDPHLLLLYKTKLLLQLIMSK